MNRIFWVGVLMISVMACSPKISKHKRISFPRKTEHKPVAGKKVSSEILVATSSVRVTTEMIQKYIDTYKDIAVVEMQRYGIPASITLAQAILESGTGQGRLARQANNHFGIKCHKGWQGETIYHDDDEKGECFRKYSNPMQSFEDHSLFLRNRTRYAFLFAYAPTDYLSWAKGLKRAGYATDAKYPEKLITLIEKYQLHKYDRAKETSSSDSLREYEVKKGDTLYSIARKWNVSIEEMKRLNGLQGDEIKVGQRLRLK